MSPRGHYFKQAERCLRLADGCTDRAMAERLRELAGEFRAKGLADEEPQSRSDAPETSSPQLGSQQDNKV